MVKLTQAVVAVQGDRFREILVEVESATLTEAKAKVSQFIKEELKDLRIKESYIKKITYTTGG